MSTERPEREPQAGREKYVATSLGLLQRARDRDREAWDRMFYLYRPLVLHWCARGGVRLEDAEDVTQDVFRELAENLDRFREGPRTGTFRAWLRGITRNLILMHFRRAGKQEHAAGGSDAQQWLEQVADPVRKDEDEPAEQITNLYYRALELVRGDFEERTWKMFWQTVVEERSPADVAAEMGVGDASVRQAKSRVLRRLKEEVGDLIN